MNGENPGVSTQWQKRLIPRRGQGWNAAVALDQPRVVNAKRSINVNEGLVGKLAYVPGQLSSCVIKCFRGRRWN